jgi:hypothetical protein
MRNPILEIHQILTKYFDALYFGDTKLFTEIFHPRARLFSATGDDFVEMNLDEYLLFVAGRQSPATRLDRRADEILSISIPTRTTAHARVQEIFLPKHFTDELTFVFINEQWKIISKVWHFNLIATT